VAINSDRVVLQYVPLAHKHLSTIMSIEAEAYPEPWSRGMFRDEIKSERSYFYVAFVDEELVGYSGFWLVADEAHITSVTTRKTWRGRGLGRQQMEHLLAEATQLGAKIATLEVRESNVTARTLYTSMGFREIGRRRQYYTTSKEDAIVMLKDLGSL
jgi:[ribosomal protein S18]-alanine N-acetyltransferase